MLRPYQIQAKDAFWAALSPEVNRVAIEMATGLGKTITFAAVIDEWLKRNLAPDAHGEDPGLRALVLVHTDELVRQAVDKILFVTGGRRDPDGTIHFGRWSIGVVKATENQVYADIVVASVQTLRVPGRREQIADVGLIVVDECHHATAPSYEDTLEYFGGMPKRYDLSPELNRPATVPVLGVTATLSRSDGQGLGRVWQDMPFSRDLSWAIRKGYLIDLVPYTIKIPELGTSMAEGALDNALAESIAPEVVVDAWLEKVDDWWPQARPSTVLFAPLVRSARAFADEFNRCGVKAEVVHGAMPDAERAAVLQRYEAGVTTVLCNAMVLTEGWDSPRTMCVIVTRLTQSVPLFVQMVGRGMRPWLAAEAPPREDQRCVLLCVQGAATTLATVADLSDSIGEVQDGKSLLAMEDEWNIGRGIEDEPELYHGPVRVEQWDPLVQRSSKAWKYTRGGVPFLPLAKRGAAYIYLVEQAQQWHVCITQTMPDGVRMMRTARIAVAPDLEWAMALAEDEALERGGEIGALLADKGRAWRKEVPSDELVALALKVGVPQREVDRILGQRAAGKAGKLSDLTDIMVATRVIDPRVVKIKERG